jgi:hypothetical protein
MNSKSIILVFSYVLVHDLSIQNIFYDKFFGIKLLFSDEILSLSLTPKLLI